METDSHGPNRKVEPPELLPEETEYDVEAILDSRKPEDKRIPIEYYIRWADFPITEDSWKPEPHLKNAQEMVEDFHINKPEAYKKPDLRQSTWKHSVPGANTA